MTYFSNRRRRRRRSRTYNRRHRRHRRHYNRHRRGHRRRRHYNRRRRGRGRRRFANASAAVGGVFGRTKRLAFSVPKLAPKILVGVGGGIANAYATGLVTGWLPSMITAGPLQYLWGIGTAAALGSLTAIASRSYAPWVFFGGLFQVATDVVRQYVVPVLSRFIPGLHGLGDYLTVQDAQNARPLGYFGDYLTPQAAAAARPLGYMGNMNDTFVSEELAAL
jgi:hypothetical protein